MSRNDLADWKAGIPVSATKLNAMLRELRALRDAYKIDGELDSPRLAKTASYSASYPVAGDNTYGIILYDITYPTGAIGNQTVTYTPRTAAAEETASTRVTLPFIPSGTYVWVVRFNSRWWILGVASDDRQAGYGMIDNAEDSFPSGGSIEATTTGITVGVDGDHILHYDLMGFWAAPGYANDAIAPPNWPGAVSSRWIQIDIIKNAGTTPETVWTSAHRYPATMANSGYTDYYPVPFSLAWHHIVTLFAGDILTVVYTSAFGGTFSDHFTIEWGELSVRTAPQ